MSEKRPFLEWGPAAIERVKPVIREREGRALEAYRCPAGVPTIGFGHTAGGKIGDKIDEITAEIWLDSDLKYIQRLTAPCIKVPVTCGQASAILSFVFNLGLGTFKKSSILRYLNKGDYDSARAVFRLYVFGGGKVLPGLKIRRGYEERLWNGEEVVPKCPWN